MKTIFKVLLCVCALSVSGAGAACAGPFEDMLDAYARRDYAMVLKLMRPLADKGNARAQFNLGLAYDNGEGVPENDAEAVKWYYLAADQGYRMAQVFLGIMYNHGQGVPESAVQAYKWWSIAAAQGDINAKTNISSIEKKMTPAQIAEAQQLVAEWKPTK